MEEPEALREEPNQREVGPTELSMILQSESGEQQGVSFHFNELSEVLQLIARLVQIAINIQTGQTTVAGVIPNTQQHLRKESEHDA